VFSDHAHPTVLFFEQPRRAGNIGHDPPFDVIKSHDSGYSEAGEVAMVAGIGACASGRLVGFASM